MRKNTKNSTKPVITRPTPRKTGEETTKAEIKEENKQAKKTELRRSDMTLLRLRDAR